MSESGELAASTQRAVAPGDNLSKPALAAVSPTSECVRLSNPDLVLCALLRPYPINEGLVSGGSWA